MVGVHKQYYKFQLKSGYSLASIYLSGLNEDFICPIVLEDYYDVYHIFTIRHSTRDVLKEHLLKQGIKTDIHYPFAPHLQPAMQGIIAGNYQISEEIHRTTLSLPISYGNTIDEVNRVVEVLNRF